jgi:protein-disulfide isomerase
MMLIGAAQTAFAEPPGFVSPNPNDMPPSFERDVESRSTDPDRPPAYGPEDAKVLVVIFADYMCPACRRGSQANHRIAAEYPGEVRMEFWNNPLVMHQGADLLAIAGLAAQRQGKFWEMSDLLFKEPKRDLESVEQKAGELGLDMDQFRKDMQDPALRQRMEEERSLAEALGATSTPSYLVNGKIYSGWGSWQSLKSKVELELKAANELAAQGMTPSEIRAQRAIDNNSDSAVYELYVNNILLAENRP